MPIVRIHKAIDNAYATFESTLIDLAKAEKVRADEIKSELEWLKWRKRHITSNKPPAYLQRVAHEIAKYATEVEKSVKH